MDKQEKIRDLKNRIADADIQASYHFVAYNNYEEDSDEWHEWEAYKEMLENELNALMSE